MVIYVCPQDGDLLLKKGVKKMTNTNKLKGRIVEKGYTLSRFSLEMGISRPCMRKKINNKTDFKASEIEKICTALEISNNELSEYFFA